MKIKHIVFLAYCLISNNITIPTNDCTDIRYKLLNKLINGSLVLHVILGYVQATDFTASNLDCCRLDFNPADPASFPYKVDISGLNLISGSARGAKFDQAILSRARFDGSDLGPGTISDGCPGQTTSFRLSVVPNGSFISFIGTLTNPTILRGADISFVHWTNTIFKYADLTGANLSNSDFHVIIFSGTNLTNTNFTNSSMRAVICDPNNPPIVNNTTLASGRITSNAFDFCKNFNYSLPDANI